MKINFQKDFKTTLEGLTLSFSGILIIGFLFSVLAPLHWLFDLGSHFVIQYIFGAIVLTPTLFYFKKQRWALAVLLVGSLSSAEFYLYHHNHYHPPLAVTSSDTTLKVVQFNRFAARFNHIPVLKWLKENDFDVVVLQEANKSLSADVKSLEKEYPYQIHQPRHDAFGMVILSRYKLNEAQRVKTGGTYYLRMTFDKLGMPITIYALHAMVPIGNIRNRELRLTAGNIAREKHENVIFMGDWNITPYSPAFKEILETTKLKHKDTSLYPAVTWSTIFMLPLLQIPIDHILFSPSLQLIEKKTGPAMGSDHYPLIATFGLQWQGSS